MKVNQAILRLIHQGKSALTQVNNYLRPGFELLVRLRGLFILMACLVLSAAFTLFKDQQEVYYPYFCNQYIPFCLTKIELTRDTYAYFLIEHIYNLLLALYIYLDPPRFKRALLIFVAIHFVDTFDYVLAYGQTWFNIGPYFIDGEKIGPYPVNWNVLKTVVFAIAIIDEGLTLIEEKWNKTDYLR